MWQIYLIMVFSTLTEIAMPFCIISGLILLIAIVFQCLYEAESKSDNCVKLWKRVKNIGISIFIPTLLITVFIPNGKQMAVIYSVGSVIEFTQNNETIQKLPDKTVKVLDKFLDEYLSENTYSQSNNTNR